MRALVSLLLLALVPAPAVAEESAAAVVTRLNAGLGGVLRDAAKLDYQARYARLEPLLAETFDLDFMARQAVGRQWEKLPPDDQVRWVEAFRRLTVATYASRFDHYSGQKFETLGEAEPAPHDTVTVASRVIDPEAENVDLTYRLHRSDGRWKVIDVYLKGSVSEIALRRSEYSSVLKREGFAALIAAVDKRIAALAAGTSAAQ